MDRTPEIDATTCRNRQIIGTRVRAPAARVIVGAGLSGLSCAVHARRAGLQPLVLEQHIAPVGTGNIRLDYFDLIGKAPRWISKARR